MSHMFNKFTHMTKPAAALTLMLALVFTGCGTQSNSLTSDLTHDAPHTIQAGAFSPVSLAQSTASPVLSKPVTVTTLITVADGGKVKLNGTSHLYSLIFPPGALDMDTEITITIPDADAALFEINLAPHGLIFNHPVTLIMDVKPDEGAAEDTAAGYPLDIYYYNDTIGAWEAQESSITQKNPQWIRGTGSLNHFSRYALGGDSALIHKMYYQNW